MNYVFLYYKNYIKIFGVSLFCFLINLICSYYLAIQDIIHLDLYDKTIENNWVGYQYQHEINLSYYGEFISLHYYFENNEFF